MKRRNLSIVMLLILLVLITACNTDNNRRLINEADGYKAYVQTGYKCAEEIEEIGSLNNNIYFFPCVESIQYTIETNDGSEYSIYQVLEDEHLSLEELYTLLDGKLYKEQLSLEVRTLFESNFTYITLYSYEYISTINNYELYTSVNSNQTCDMEVSFTINEAEFNRNSGCANDFITIGYFAIKDNTLYKIENLVTSGEISVDDILTIEERFLEYTNPRLNTLLSQSEILTQNEDTYYVYFYSLTCGHCNSMKADIISHILQSDDTFYLASVQDLQVNGGWPADITGVPTMVKVVNGELTERFVGTSEIASLIE